MLRSESHPTPNPDPYPNQWATRAFGTFFLIACLIVALPDRAGALQFANNSNIAIENGGRLWLEGTTTLMDYRCRAESLEGLGTLQNEDNPTQNIKNEGNVAVTVTIPVSSLNCGKKAMNQDMYQALKADRFPDIKYRLLSASLSDSTITMAADTSTWMDIRTTGLLEIAGVADTTSVSVEGKLLSPVRFRVRGHKRINMLDYRVKPPQAFLGLIKADEHLTVHFDVTVRLNN